MAHENYSVRRLFPGEFLLNGVVITPVSLSITDRRHLNNAGATTPW